MLQNKSSSCSNLAQIQHPTTHYVEHIKSNRFTARPPRGNFELGHLLHNPDTCFSSHSCLVAITCMPLANANGTEKIGRSHIMEVQQMLDLLKSTIENSNASLYSPTNDEIQANCTFKFMHCYLLELEVILIETFDKHETTRTEIHHMKKLLERQQQFNSSTCLPCEAQTVANSTTFLKNFEFLLKRINNTL
uniref:Interleukin n=1 Tax=Esox lucius TaxID=8010 RepID=A0A3P8YE88_ESOLU